jgi:hypothetical protein
MQHSTKSVRTPDLRCSCCDLHSERAGSASNVAVTCDAITRLHQPQTMLHPLLLHPTTRMMRQMQRKAQRRGGMPLASARQAQVFGRVGKPLPTSLDAGVPLRDVQEAASHADPRTTMRYDRARGSLDRHATYIVAAYIAGAAR